MAGKSSGGVAAVAVLIGILAIAVGTGAIMIMDQNKITDNKNIPAVVESVAESSAVEKLESSEPELPPEPETLMEYPEKAASYKNITDRPLTADYAILLDSDENTIIAGKNYNKRMYPASLTKVMTLIVAAENIDDIHAKYKFSANDIDPLVEEDASRAGFSAGEEVTVEDLMNAAILTSGADGTVGLANVVAGSERAFVTMMNDKAKELGLKNTHFVNASGLHNKYHYSTCEDMAMILKYAMDNDICKKILTTTTYRTSRTPQHKQGLELTNILTMRLDGYYVEGGGDIIGGKTGFTTEAKYTLSTQLDYEGKNYICVTARSDGEFISIEDTILIYERYVPRGVQVAQSLASAADSSSAVA